MQCPFCHSDDTKVVDSRLVVESNQVRRRRACLHCPERFTTYETPELALPYLVKRDGRRAHFDESKLKLGVTRALEKRPVSIEAMDNLINVIITKLRTTGEKEVSTELLGKWVMEELKKLDLVAYIRFASVYQSFKDVQSFINVIEGLKEEPNDRFT